MKNVLRGEMAKYGLTIADMSRVLGISTVAYSSKLNSKVDFSLTEAKKIIQHFEKLGEKHTVESLFFASKSEKAN